MMQATVTGIRLRGFHSNNRSSTARRMAANGVPKIPDSPAAAPATMSVLRSESERWMNWAISELKAPPVMITGPSAPNGPPEPMATEAERGLKIATRGVTALPLSTMASMASGIPWPRIFSVP